MSTIPKLKIPIQSDTAFPCIKQGDTIPKIVITFDDTYDINLTLFGVSIKMQLYKDRNKVMDLSIGSGITVIGARVFEIDEVEKEDNIFPYGTLLGDLEVTDANGDRFTYFDVEYTILKQYTV